MYLIHLHPSYVLHLIGRMAEPTLEVQRLVTMVMVRASLVRGWQLVVMAGGQQS